MQIDILHLYEQARSGTLTAKELAWLDEQVREYPYFALPRTILAKHHHTQQSPDSQRQLLTSAAFSANRRLLRSYILDSIAKGKAHYQKDEETTAEKKPESPGTDPASEILSNPAADNSVPFKSEANTAESSEKAPEKPSEAPEIPEGTPVGQTNWFLQTALNIRKARYKGMLGKLEQEMAKAPASPQPTVTASEPAHSSAEQSPAKEPSANPEKAIAKAPKEEKAYEIGSFSSFSFVGDVEENEEGEIDSSVTLSPSLTLESPIEGTTIYSELVIEEEDRRLEILVTPEELEKYFRGRLPKPGQGLRLSDLDKPKLEFDFKPIDFSIGTQQEKTEVKEATSQKETAPIVDELIDRFIENEPTIARVDQYQAPKGDLAKPSSEDADDWVTETLAKVYAMQGNHAKAIKIYKKLALLFPEKSAYFDDLIQKLKK